MDMRQEMEAYTQDLRDRICRAFEGLDTAKFERTAWRRAGEGGGGGLSVVRGRGVEEVMGGRVCEKVRVNCWSVWGELDTEMAAKLHSASTAFYATGISLVAHMANPMVPAVHMNLPTLRW